MNRVQLENHAGIITKKEFEEFINWCESDNSLKFHIKKRKIQGRKGTIDKITAKHIAVELSRKVKIGKHPSFFVWFRDAFVECNHCNIDFVFNFV